MSKLSDKAKGISFDDVDGEDDAGPATPLPAVDRPRTGIGLISASLAMGRGVEAENRELKDRLERLEGATIVEMLDPKRIRPSRFANRHELSFTGPQFASLKEEIAAAGHNVQAIKVRPIKAAGEQGVDFEIAFGHRRHRACLELGLPVAAVVEELTDAQLFAEMDRENREREDLSAWEQGVMYKRALDEGLFPSLRKLAASVGAQPGNVSTAVQLASLPADLVAAFPSPLALQFRWAAPLAAAWERDPSGVRAIATELASLEPRLPAKEVFERLTGLQPTTARPSPTQIEFQGKVVAQWDRDAKGNLAVRVKSGALSEAKERRLLEFLRKLFA